MFVFILTTCREKLLMSLLTEELPPAASHLGKITVLFPWPGTQAHENILSVLLFWDPLEISYSCSYCRSSSFYCALAELQLRFGFISIKGIIHYMKFLNIVLCAVCVLNLYNNNVAL